jgi:hypothetical protein
MNMNFSANNNGASLIAYRRGELEIVAKASSGTHPNEGDYPCAPFAWLAIEDPYDGGPQNKFTWLLERGDIVHLQGVLSTLLGELDANQKDYEARAPKKE